MKKTLIFSMAVVMLCLSVNAATVAYWRFEDGTDGVVNSTYVDSSGNDSTMTVNGAVGSTDVMWPIVPDTGQANALAADYVATSPDSGDYLTTDGSQYIDTFNFDGAGWTIEAVVKFNDYGTNSVFARPGIVCKEGELGVDRYPYFNLQLDTSSEVLRVVTARDGGSRRIITSSQHIDLGKWYAIAVTYDRAAVDSDRAVELYVKEETDLTYDKVGDSGGPWSAIDLNGDLPWTIGRGFRDNAGKGYVDGTIDEVRISDVVLAESDFLGTIPEPSLIIGGIALALLAFRRK